MPSSGMVDIGRKFCTSNWNTGVCWDYGLRASHYQLLCLLYLSQFVFQVDGYVARRWKMQSVLGTILDPAADKALMATLTVTLTMKGLLPRW